MEPLSFSESSAHTADNNSRHDSSGSISKERLLDGEVHSRKRRRLLPKDSEAANFNRRVLEKLQLAFDRNPEVDLLSKLLLNYSDGLQPQIEELEDKGTSLLHHCYLACSRIL